MLWEKYPDAMRAALERHDSLLNQIFAAYHGFVFKTTGDSFCTAFTKAPDALSAAVACQQALALEQWRTPVPLRVRMAIHTGTVEQRDNDYFGPPLNRVARLLAIGHGGQVLLSNAAQELVRDMLPAGAEVRDLGEHRLRDLSRPEHVFQAVHPALPSQFPPLRSLDNPELPNNLPQQTTSFIGREKDLREVNDLLKKTRVLTLSGMGGSGKTRLSLQIAADILDQYSDGVWFIELAHITDASLVSHSVAAALSIREEPGHPVLQTLCTMLKTKKLLIILDNCEHLVEECARMVATLLQACPDTTFFTSSREALGVPGEMIYRIPPLSLPDLQQRIVIETLTQYEAVRLFVERATFHKSDFAVTNENAASLAQLCVSLDGIPLAIELAAARVRAMSVEEINSRLNNLFRLLTGGVRTALPRQQTLRALIDWSYDLLNEQERVMLHCLSVFRGGWTLEAAEAVCTGDTIEDWEALDLMSSLVDKSLVLTESLGSETRYRLLETVRQYAREKLEDSGASDDVRRRHCLCFLALAESAERAILGSQQATWLRRLDLEHDNMRSALDWSLNISTGAEMALRLTGALGRYWWRRGYLRMGRDYLETALKYAGVESRTAARAKALHWSGVMHFRLGEYDNARTALEHGLELARETGETTEEMLCLNTLGNMSVFLRELDAAKKYYEQGLIVVRRLGDRSGEAMILGNMGNLCYDLEDYAGSRELYQQAIEIFRATRHQIGEAIYLANLGRVLLKQEELQKARDYLTQGLHITRELRDRGQIVFGLWSFAQLNAKEGNLEIAARLLGASDSLRDEIGNTLSSSALEEHAELSETLHNGLGEEAFTINYNIGNRMNWDQAVALVLGEG